MSRNRIITLTTDFGQVDAYVGIMKGVILTMAPEVSIVDISHNVPPQQVESAAYLLETAYRYFPADTTHVVVVDPGVGTKRQPIAIRTNHGVFVGPDNGVFGRALSDQGALRDGGRELFDCAGVVLADEQFWRSPVSQTFHGRDIFAPVAAHLAMGVPIADLGRPLRTVHVNRQKEPSRRRGALYGSVVYVDHFGNAITNLPHSMLPERPQFEVADRVLFGLASSYQEANVVAIVGSSGLVEIAARNGSAADTLGLGVGDQIVVRAQA